MRTTVINIVSAQWQVGMRKTSIIHHLLLSVSPSFTKEPQGQSLNSGPKMYDFVLQFKSNVIHGETGKKTPTTAVYISGYILSHLK